MFLISSIIFSYRKDFLGMKCHSHIRNQNSWYPHMSFTSLNPSLRKYFVIAILHPFFVRSVASRTEITVRRWRWRLAVCIGGVSLQAVLFARSDVCHIKFMRTCAMFQRSNERHDSRRMFKQTQSGDMIVAWVSRIMQQGWV